MLFRSFGKEDCLTAGRFPPPPAEFLRGGGIHRQILMTEEKNIQIITNGDNVVVLHNGVRVRDPERVVANLAENSRVHRNLYTEILNRIKHA